jgi:hypothetical protein
MEATSRAQADKIAQLFLEQFLEMNQPNATHSLDLLKKMH